MTFAGPSISGHFARGLLFAGFGMLLVFASFACSSSNSTDSSTSIPDASNGAGGIGGSGGSVSTGGVPGTGATGATGGSGGSGGANMGGTGGAPLVTTPPCSGNEPASGATCDTTLDGSCRLGGFSCGCDCNCGNLCANTPPGTCMCSSATPGASCTWGCFFSDFAGLLDVHDVTISLDCSNPSTATITVTVNIGLRAAASGPALTIGQFWTFISAKDGGGAMLPQCGLPMASLTVGPIAPGTEQPAVFTVGPTTCIGTDTGSLCAACGSTATMRLNVDINNAASGYYVTIGRSATNTAGTLFPITCTR